MDISNAALVGRYYPLLRPAPPLKRKRSDGQADYYRNAKFARTVIAPSPLSQRVRAANAVPANWMPSGTEIKAIDLPATVYNFRDGVGATNLILLNGVQTGTAFFNRVGSRIEMKNLHVRGIIRNVATSVSTVLRMLIIYDRQPVGSLPATSDVIQSRDQTGAAATTGDSEINLDNRDRFTIIRDLEWYAPSVTNTAGVLTNGPNFPGNEPRSYGVNEFIKLKGLGCHFKSTSNPATIADIATGALYAMFTSQGGTDQGWSFTGGFRLRFEDK